MSDNKDSRGVRNSVRIYGWLLAVYPADFRREYGAAMQQLFRDQCREAQRAKEGWGLAYLWLRTLPDIAKTMLVEHVASLSQTGTTFKETILAIRGVPMLRTTFVRVFRVVFVCAVCFGAFMAYWTPIRYYSAASMELRKGAPILDVSGDVRPNPPNDPYFLATQFRIIHSWGILTQVITHLNLQHVLARQAAEPDWSLDKTFEYLLPRIRVAQTPGTSFVEIKVENADPNEAAKIANSIAESYRNYRLQLSERVDWIGPTQAGARNGPDSQPVVIHAAAKPDLRNRVQSTPVIFLIWLFRGTLVAFFASGAIAWCGYAMRRKKTSITA